MQAIREIVEIKSHKLQFTLPKNFNGKKVEMILLPVEKKETPATKKKHLKFGVKMEDFKFDREELHERIKSIAWKMGKRSSFSREELHERS